MRTKLRYLIAPVWILNMIFLFGSISSIFANEDGLLSVRQLSLVGLFFVFFIYLFYDIVKFNRPVFIRIIGSILVLSAIFLGLVGNYLMVIPSLVTGILTLRKH